MHIQRVDTIASTSLALRQQIESASLRTPTAIIAREQTGGIGQFGRRWFSPRGGLWFSAAFPLAHAHGSRALSDYVAGDATRSALGLRLGIVCREVLASFIADRAPAIKIRLKPPNDLLLVSPRDPHGAKVAGILTEIISPPAPHAAWLLIGIGINTNVPTALLPTGLAHPATSLLAEMQTGRAGTEPGKPIENDALFHALLSALAAEAT